MKHEIPVWQMVKRAMEAHDGKATNLQVRDWIRKRWPDVPKNTIGCQRIICTVNQPSRVGFPENMRPRPATARYDFLYAPARGELEWYDPKQHGRWEIAEVGDRLVARRIPIAQKRATPPKATPPAQWILVHSERAFNERTPYQIPAAELLAEFVPGILWNWRLTPPMRADARRRKVLLGWDGAVFGEATASITRRIDRAERRKGSTFAFELHDYSLLERPIPYERLHLGNRASNHRSLIKLTAANLSEYRRLRRAQPVSRSTTETVALGDADHGQGIGLTAAERQAVAQHGMDMAKRELTARGYEHVDVSRNRSFDLSARVDGKHYFVEVKATTGNGKSVFLTANEVELHDREYPHNILILVHGITLTAAGKARGGEVHFESGWRLDPDRLKPVTFRYARPT
jgi:hypothetical protein